MGSLSQESCLMERKQLGLKLLKRDRQNSIWQVVKYKKYSINLFYSSSSVQEKFLNLIISSKKLNNNLDEIILSGGAINSPQLLMLSGIGPKHHLEQVPIRQGLTNF